MEFMLRLVDVPSIVAILDEMNAFVGGCCPVELKISVARLMK
jgi:hypothetical protein